MDKYQNPPGYEDDPDEDDTDDEAEQDDGDYTDPDDPANWNICGPLWSPQPRD